MEREKVARRFPCARTKKREAGLLRPLWDFENVVAGLGGKPSKKLVLWLDWSRSWCRRRFGCLNLAGKLLESLLQILKGNPADHIALLSRGFVGKRCGIQQAASPVLVFHITTESTCFSAIVNLAAIA